MLYLAAKSPLFSRWCCRGPGLPKRSSTQQVHRAASCADRRTQSAFVRAQTWKHSLESYIRSKHTLYATPCLSEMTEQDMT